MPYRNKIDTLSGQDFDDRGKKVHHSTAPHQPSQTNAFLSVASHGKLLLQAPQAQAPQPATRRQNQARP
jgi:hypothetical protein